MGHFFAGLVVGIAATYFGLRLLSPVYAIGHALYFKAGKDFYAAMDHVARYAKGVVNAIDPFKP